MLRTFIGGLAGFALGILFLIGWGISDGLASGLPTAGLPPGIEAAWKCGFVYTMYFWPLALVFGGGAGALCGFGTWLAKVLSQTVMSVANSNYQVGTSDG